jgi:hypothetical protein
MLKLKIKCHKVGRIYQSEHVFILSVGLNAGKPIETPCANCYVLLVDNKTERDFYYWLCFGLWQGRFLDPCLTGSVIPFIRINDLCKIIQEAADKANLRPDKFKETLTLMNQLNQHQSNIMEQVKLIKSMKKALMYKVLK